MTRQSTRMTRQSTRMTHQDFKPYRTAVIYEVVSTRMTRQSTRMTRHLDPYDTSLDSYDTSAKANFFIWLV